MRVSGLGLVDSVSQGAGNPRRVLGITTGGRQLQVAPSSTRRLGATEDISSMQHGFSLLSGALLKSRRTTLTHCAYSRSASSLCLSVAGAALQSITLWFLQPKIFEFLADHSYLQLRAAVFFLRTRAAGDQHFRMSTLPYVRPQIFPSL